MKTREEAIAYCKSLPDVYEDYPFHDANWTVMRRRTTHRGFAFIYERLGAVWINVKCDPVWREIWRQNYSSVVPAYHMNKKYWNSIILDGNMPEEEICRMIAESHDLTGK